MKGPRVQRLGSGCLSNRRSSVVKIFLELDGLFARFCEFN